MRSPCATTRGSPHSLQLEKSLCGNEDPAQSKINTNFKKKRKVKKMKEMSIWGSNFNQEEISWWNRNGKNVCPFIQQIFSGHLLRSGTRKTVAMMSSCFCDNQGAGDIHAVDFRREISNSQRSRCASIVWDSKREDDKGNEKPNP